MAHPAVLRQAQALGLMGLLPFFAFATLAWLPEDAVVGHVGAAQLAQRALVAYAAVILSFLGAVHWGVVLAAPTTTPQLARSFLMWGVVPALLGWLALLMMFLGLAPWLVLSFLIADLLLVRMMDGALFRQHPTRTEGYLELRTRLTAGATLALAIALAATI
jgi:hypothetical protein